MRELGIATIVEAHISAKVLKTTLEVVSFKYRRESLEESEEKLALLRNGLSSIGRTGEELTSTSV